MPNDAGLAMKHTLGPWKVTMTSQAQFGIKIRSDAELVATLPLGDVKMGKPVDPAQHERAEANARLIAAAPELLAALEMYEKALNERDDSFLPHGQFQTASIRARAAIAKAKSPA